MDGIRKKKYCDRKRRFGRFVHAVLRSHSKSISISQQTCSHAAVLQGICIRCKKAMQNCYGFSFDYLLKGLRFSYGAVCRLKERHTNTLLKNGKLVLVLDLDNTLLHSCRLKNLSSNEQYLKEQIDSVEINIPKRSSFELKDIGYLVKLRPYVRSFLEEASNMFEMYICNMGTRIYAKKVAKLLDPDSKYFNCRIIAFEDFKPKGKKNLNLVLGWESNIIILDDTESVWSDHVKNLITVGKYEYFKRSRDVRSYAEEKTDESESNGALASILRVMKTVYTLFFDNPASGDVQSLLAKTRGEILKGCTLLFSNVQDFPLFTTRAELMGAVCTTTMDSIVTQVVSSDTKNEYCQRAKQEKKFLVHPLWIEESYFLWSRQPEEDYFP